MNIKDTLSVVGGGTVGLATSIAEKTPTVLGSEVEFWHLILYSFLGGCVGWVAKEFLDYLKNKVK